jgi:hypothetical protein
MSEPHFSRDELIAWRDDGAGDPGRLVDHLAACEVCRGVAADVARSLTTGSGGERFDLPEFVSRGYRAGSAKAAPRGASLRILLAAAAVLTVLALVPAWLTRLEERSDSLRGAPAALVPVRPVDVSISVEELSFEWQGASATDRVRLNVVDLDRPEEPLIEREVTGSRYEPTPEERRRFRPGQSVHWYVEGRGGSGAPSAAVSFQVR